MKLYYSKGACSLAPHIIVNELNIPCELEAVDLKTKKTGKNEDFLAINPKGAVPTLVTDDDEVLTENAVILQYLAESQKNTQLLPPVGDFKRFRTLEWVNYIATELHKGFGPLFNPSIPQELKEQIFIPLIKKKFDFLEEHFKATQGTYLQGDTFTLPDAYLCVVLLWTGVFKIDLMQWPKLATYFSALKKRPAIEKTFTDEGLRI